MKVFVLLLHGESETDHEVVRVSSNKEKIEVLQATIEGFISDARYFKGQADEMSKGNYIVEGGERKEHKKTKDLLDKYTKKMIAFRTYLMSLDKEKFSVSNFRFGEGRPWTELQEMELET